MRLFVSEFICGGGWSSGERPASLVREGAAMLRAFLRDLLRIEQLRVVTTWDRRLGVELGIDSAALDVVSVSDPDEEREVFARLCEEVDGVYVIAPELGDELLRRVLVVDGSAKRCSFSEQKTADNICNCTAEAIDLCGDKWALFEHFSRRGIPTIPTCRIGGEDNISSLAWPRVLKLRMGAGSQLMQLVSSPREWENAVRQYDSSSRCTEAIVQPWVRGTALSVGAIIDRSGTVHVLPTADQHIDPSQGFAYLGGRIPSARSTRSLDTLIWETLSTIPGLLGYVGVDLLVPESSPEDPLIVEINPRLTTSYVGYQQLCLDNLAALWIGDAPVSPTPRWRPGFVEFDSAGRIR